MRDQNNSKHRRVATSGKYEVAGTKSNAQNHSLKVVKSPET